MLKLRKLLCLSYFIFISFSLSISAQTVPKYKILLLFTFGEFSQWEEDFIVSYREILESNQQYKFELYVENLDVGNDDPRKSPNYNDAVKIVSRYGFDLVISIHSTAGKFVQHQKESAFKNTSVIFVLPDDELVKIAERDVNTEYIESASKEAVGKTLDLVPELFPQNSGIIFISGSGRDDSYYLSIARAAVKQKKLKSEYLLEKTIPQIIDYLKRK